MNSVYRVLRSSPITRASGGIFGGIAAGIAVKFGWHVTYVRIVMLLSFLLPVLGIGLYAVLWLLMPKTDGTIVLEKLLSSR